MLINGRMLVKHPIKPIEPSQYIEERVYLSSAFDYDGKSLLEFLERANKTGLPLSDLLIECGDYGFCLYYIEKKENKEYYFQLEEYNKKIEEYNNISLPKYERELEEHKQKCISDLEKELKRLKEEQERNNQNA